MITTRQATVYITTYGQEFYNEKDACEQELYDNVRAWVDKRLCSNDNSALDVASAIAEDREGLLEALKMPEVSQ